MAEGFKDFTPGEVLTASNVDDYLMRQSVMRFASATARDTALTGGIATEGMFAYLKDVDQLTLYLGTAWIEFGLGVLRFASAAARDTALSGALTEGMVCFLKDIDAFTVYSGSAWVEFGRISAFTTFSPTLVQSSTVTKTDTYCVWNRIGRQITYQAKLTVTGTGVASNAITVTLPATAVFAAGNPQVVGSGYVYDSSTSSLYKAIAVLNSASLLAFYAANTASAAQVGVDSFTVALASGDGVSFAVTYEAAS